jgi:hypothetical protein
LLPGADGGCDNGDVVIGDDGGGAGNAGGGPGVTPTPCYAGGCSGQLCTNDPNAASTCEWAEAYACYASVGICEADANDQCGWKQTAELIACIDAANRVPVEGVCVKNAGDACSSDADCTSGGCGGELCYNPSISDGVSTCECTAPNYGCGCVQGSCSWYE